ncbi:Stk1 family PASTA domain-containing Ser/Thr kinase, partial [Nostocoides japonicum]|uniref:Stk1 family PASTA domain-containing Ser/Thr kinase n=1 Tax=Nostocoides japonicum TaxID=99481 RepID=UPI0009F9A419
MTTPHLLGGRYEVDDLVGRGGMAEVHRGFDTRLGRQVAIKLLRSDLARDQSFLGRFRREAQSAAGLNHPSIVAVYDSGEDHVTQPGGAVVPLPYIVMEYVEGCTLREYLAERDHLDPADAARITESVLDALAYSHRHGIVHRDIKPANVMVGDHGEVKVMDFGIARAVADSNATMTQTQAVIGTAQYLSPEQAQGMQVDARSDLYSTGCLLFELLTGRAPFQGDTPVAIAYQHVGEVPVRPSAVNPEVPEALDAVVCHALVKDREGRYQSAEEFRTDVLRARIGGPVSDAAMASLAALSTGAAAYATRGSAGGIGEAMPTEVYAAQTYPVQDEKGNTASLPAVGHDPDDEEKDRRRVGAYLLLTLAVLVAVGLIGWGVSRLLTAEEPKPPTQVTVPKIVGLTEQQAQAALSARHLRWERNPVDSNEPAGEVLSQSQEAGTKVNENYIVNYDVSLGPSTLALPNVAGLSVADATDRLTEDGFKVAGRTKTVDNSRYPKGQVDSTDPAIGTPTQTGTTVTLKVSSGKVTVPSVVGKSQSDAATALAEAGLSPAFASAESDAAPGTVIAQSPRSGLVDRGSTVRITVAIPRPPTSTTTSAPPTTTAPTTSPTTSETTSPTGTATTPPPP